MTSDVSPAPPPAARRLALAMLPVCVVAGLAILSLAGQFATRWNIPLPPCLFRKVTGLPCFSCGCTRSLTAWSHFDLAAAFRFNPLFFLLCVSAVVWLALWSVEKLSGRRLLDPVRALIRRRTTWAALAALVLLNWGYLCLTLPR